MNAIKQLPCDIDSERAIIGACWIDERNIDQAVQILAADGREFHDGDLGRVFSMLVRMRMSGVPFGANVIVQAKKLGLSMPITELFRIVQTSTPNHAPYFARNIRERWQVRRQIEALETALAIAYRPDSDPAEIESAASAARIDATPEKPERIDVVAQSVVESLFERRNGGGKHVLFGIRKLDESTGGMCGGELIVVAARPGCGKTSFAMQVAMHVAKRGHVLFVSLEMTKSELAARVITAEAGIDSRAVRAGKLAPYEYDKLTESLSAVAGHELQIWSPSKASVNQILSSARIRANFSPLSLVVVDYIGLVRPDDHRIPRHEQVAQVTRDLKTLAKELDCPVIALCQLNREGDESPRLVHLRESGSIEQDADMVILLHKTSETTVDMKVAKHRQGEVGTIGMEWCGKRTRFVEPEPRKHDFGGF